ncbi:MAG: ribosome silencing factor [Alphaproteobacteria bacterium]|nr:ribosome silencing factor [Alphaproteobacteria bacterium]
MLPLFAGVDFEQDREVVAAADFPEKLLETVQKILDERKAEDIVTVALAGRSALADYMVIASGQSGRQLLALADYLDEAFRKAGVVNVRIEGKTDANWVLVDAGDVIVHLFLPDVRAYYDLDTLWSKSPEAE